MEQSQVPAEGGSAFEQGNRLAKKGDLAGAEEAYRQADQDGHGAAAAYVGLFAESRGEFDAAQDAYRRADERGDGFGSFRLGLLLSRAGDWDGAAAAWARADERGRQDPPFDHMALVGASAGAVGDQAAPEIQRSAFANPVLIGAVTVLVAIVGVFLAYNANNGLPFVPTRELRVDVATGAAAQPGIQVTSAGGYRIGLVSQVLPVRLPSGVIGAQLVLKLSQSFGPVPVDSTAAIRPRNLFGLKYIDLERGTSSQSIPDGGVLPASHTSVPVQFDDINKLFDAKTRPAIDQNLVGFGDTLTGRGSSLNDTFASLPDLLLYLRPVAQYLADPSTQLTRLFSSLNSFFGTVSPVAQVNERLFADQATTYEAISRDAFALEDTIRQSPPTLVVGTDSLAAQQPFLVDLKTFSNDLNPASLALRNALPNIDPALEAGIRVLPRTPAVNEKLRGVLNALKDVAQTPTTNMAVNALSSTVDILNPVIRYLGPFVTVCNGFNYVWTQLGDVVSEPTSFGMSQRALLNSANHQANNVGDQGATASANGYQPGDPPPASDAEYVHGPAYSPAINSDGTADCEIGQHGYQLRQNTLDPQQRAVVTDAYTPGSQGTTWTGRPRVPAGETFSRTPDTGPQLPPEPGNSG
jgi:virulence factor Mce-like protein